MTNTTEVFAYAVLHGDVIRFQGDDTTTVYTVSSVRESDGGKWAFVTVSHPETGLPYEITALSDEIVTVLSGPSKDLDNARTRD